MSHRQNYYLKAYDKHYHVTERAAVNECQHLLLGLVHAQELVNRVFTDVAGMLAVTLRAAGSPRKKKADTRPLRPKTLLEQMPLFPRPAPPQFNAPAPLSPLTVSQPAPPKQPATTQQPTTTQQPATIQQPAAAQQRIPPQQTTSTQQPARPQQPAAQQESSGEDELVESQGIQRRMQAKRKPSCLRCGKLINIVGCTSTELIDVITETCPEHRNKREIFRTPEVNSSGDL